MKRTAISIMIMLGLASGLQASDYRTLSAQARQSLKELESAVLVTTESAVTVTAQYEALANVAPSDESKVWCLNNAAYANIVLFKKLVRYYAANAEINALNPKSKERIALVKALQAEYVKYRTLLDNTDPNLKDGIVISQHLNNERQKNVLDSNYRFVIDSLIFIEQKF